MGSVDVIVPCYRYGHYLRQCVESVLAEPIPQLRVLVIDDCSPDETAAVAMDLVDLDPRVHFIRHDRNKGHISTYNEGIDWVCADYLLLLSADDYLLPGALQRAVMLLDAHPEVGFVFGEVIVQVEGDPLQLDDEITRCHEQIVKQILTGIEFIKLSGPSNIVPAPTAVVRTALQKRLGGYLPDLPHTADQEMWLRLAAHASVGILRARQAVYRRHSTNMSLAYTSNGWLGDLQQRKAALARFFESCSSVLPNASLMSKRLSRQLARGAMGLASSAFNEGNIEASISIREFARDIDSTVRWSLIWFKLVIKHRIGYPTWHTLQEVINTVHYI